MSNIISHEDLIEINQANNIQMKFNLSEPPNYVGIIILELYYIFFIPMVITSFFLIFTSSWYIQALNTLIPDDFMKYICNALLFFGITFIIFYTYTIVILDV